MKKDDPELVMAELEALDEDIDRFIESNKSERKPDNREYLAAYDLSVLIDDCYENDLPISLEEVKNTRSRLQYAGSESALDYMNATMQKNMAEAKKAAPIQKERISTSPPPIIPQQKVSTTPARGAAPLPPIQKQPPPLPPKPAHMKLPPQSRANIQAKVETKESEAARQWKRPNDNSPRSTKNPPEKSPTFSRAQSGSEVVSNAAELAKLQSILKARDAVQQQISPVIPNMFKAAWREAGLVQIAEKLDPLKERAQNQNNKELLAFIKGREKLAKECLDEPVKMIDILANTEEKVNKVLDKAQSKNVSPVGQKK